MSVREALLPYQDALPAFNALMNGAATALMLAGWFCIRAGNRRAHAGCMAGAVLASVVFLASYVVYHWLKAGLVTRFEETGWIRWVYLFVLVTHVVLAAFVPFLVAATLWPALRGRFDAHRRVARWTYPIWLYVSVTGVLVYLMLYVWFPPGGGD